MKLAAEIVRESHAALPSSTGGVMVAVGPSTLYPTDLLQSYMGLDVSENALRSRAPACLQVCTSFARSPYAFERISFIYIRAIYWIDLFFNFAMILNQIEIKLRVKHDIKCTQLLQKSNCRLYSNQFSQLLSARSSRTVPGSRSRL